MSSMTISESFQLMLGALDPTEAELSSVVQHLGTVKTRLESTFELKKFLKVGSFSRGTFISGHSDVDVFAVVSRDEVRRGSSYVSSNTVLDNFKQELEGRFWNSIVYRDVQAVEVEFADSQVDVVPAFFGGVTEQNWPLYHMPDGAGGWMRTSPGLHNAYIKQENEASIGKIRGTARLMKYWRECRSPRIPLSSFYIEMVLASEGICRGVKSYAQCMTEVLQLIAQRECRGMLDPLHISGSIEAVKTLNQRDASLTSIRYSRDHAKSALSAEKSQDIEEAKRQWDIVFNGLFPW